MKTNKKIKYFGFQALADWPNQVHFYTSLNTKDYVDDSSQSCDFCYNELQKDLGDDYIKEIDLIVGDAENYHTVNLPELNPYDGSAVGKDRTEEQLKIIKEITTKLIGTNWVLADFNDVPEVEFFAKGKTPKKEKKKPFEISIEVLMSALNAAILHADNESNRLYGEKDKSKLVADWREILKRILFGEIPKIVDIKKSTKDS